MRKDNLFSIAQSRGLRTRLYAAYHPHCKIFREFLDEWVRRFPSADVHRFEDSGHYVLEDAAEVIIPRNL